MSGGASAGSQKGYNNSNSRYSGTTMPIVPDDWMKDYTNLDNNLGGTGITQPQQQNLNDLSNIGAGQNAYTQAGYYSLADLSKNFGGEWATPKDVVAQNVAAQQGSDFMGAYKNPWDQSVVDTSLADYDAGWDRSLNAQRAGRDASGAFGDRAAIADAVFNADAARGRGSLASGLRQQGFNTAAGLGQSDANRFLTASQTNAANKLSADTFNNNLTNNRQQFSVNEALQGDQNRMQAFRDMRDTTLAKSGIEQGGIGNLMSLLSIGLNRFGSSQEGTSSTQSVNGAKSKGGGVSGPLF